MNKIINLTNGIVLFIVICFAVIFLMKGNSAPGCNQVPFIAGGCFSKFVIINEKTEPHISCLKFSKNNCNWPELSISSSCKEPVYINGTKIPFESCSVTEEKYWILRNNNEYEIFPENKLSSQDLIDLSEADFSTKFRESCIAEDNNNTPFEIKIGNEKYDIQFNSKSAAGYSHESGLIHSHSIIGTVGNCLTYALHGFPKKNCLMMQISTKCGENIELLNERIEPNKKCRINNSYLILNTRDDNSSYQGEQIPPLKNKKFFVDGMIGEKEFKISFTVTKKLCD